METALIIVIILLVLAVGACVLMVMSIRQYNGVLLEQRRMIKKLTRQCQEAEQRSIADSYRAANEKNMNTGRSDAVELRNLRRQNATLVRQVEDAEKIKQAFLVLKDRCRQLEEAQGIPESKSVQKDILNTQVLTAELTRIKHAYVQHLKEHGKMQESLDEAKAANLTLTSRLQCYEQENAQLTDLLHKAKTAAPSDDAPGK